MITAEHLTKTFGSFTAIEDVGFTVARGEIVGFLGPNGAGKTTTMRILAGVFPPTRGRALVGGYDVAREPLRARAVVGYFPERIALYGDMTVRAYLRYVARMKDLDAATARDSIGWALGRCDLEPVADRLIGTLSKGFRQRVGIAQALLGAPRVLILDEPTAGLDPEQVADVRALIRDLRRDSTVILSTHILPEVEATCDRVIIINRGRIRAVDTPANLHRLVRDTVRVHLEIKGPAEAVRRTLAALPGVTEVQLRPAPADGATHVVVTTAQHLDLREQLAATVWRSGWALRELRPMAPSLEEIFLSLISEPPAADGPAAEAAP
jgi:ABC-2 type transport system ATP-binding protein